ncbi:MAG: ATP-dependent protease subunit HslV [Firmicutes bacterium]|jgi:ATP-dependent HslUV protease subunit HslV|nr:ATP-dependent protease subunit HslV [Bacillota bacterium]MBV1728313.1 ATP-dependent protease subunit HslV [Desulforudis sp.]MBU4533925.1 ATP-dependent protease subunit HslV [Bacillota bacterium]MBU4553859.1 ATP-dependent protease subunit HslV [Bacillota bacterium]MBV1734879.1 ATP-dependent protease subunit HslV [Desulforudis sp.]
MGAIQSAKGNVKLFTGTTIIAVRKDGRTAVAGDGQVSLASQTIIKQNAVKIRRLYKNQVIAGFAGGVADAFALFERFEGKLEEAHGNLARAAVQLAKDWRTDKSLRRLEALLVVADVKTLLLISGSGEVIEPDDGIVAVGSGGSFALAAARALARHADLSAREIAREALEIAAEICVFTNKNITIEELIEEELTQGGGTVGSDA